MSTSAREIAASALAGERLIIAAGRAFLLVSVGFWMVFLAAPIVVTLGASLTATEFTMFPPVGISFRWYETVLKSQWFLPSLLTSTIVAALATSLSIAMGTVGAIVLAQHQMRGKAVVEHLLMSPLIIPSVVIGFALFNAVIQINTQDMALLNLVVGHAIVTLPFTVRSIWSSLVGFDRNIEAAAMSLGATPWATFWRVTLPSILPGIIAGTIIAFSFSFNDVTISIFLVGPQTKTLPVELMSQIEYLPDPSPAAASAVVIMLTLLFFVIAERTVGLDVFHKSD